LTLTNYSIFLFIGLAKQNGRIVPLTKKDIARRASCVVKPSATLAANKTAANAGDGEIRTEPPVAASRSDECVRTAARKWQDNTMRHRRVTLAVAPDGKSGALAPPRSLLRRHSQSGLRIAATAAPVAWVAPNTAATSMRSNNHGRKFSAGDLTAAETVGRMLPTGTWVPGKYKYLLVNT
jgi:hypothetical protein